MPDSGSHPSGLAGWLLRHRWLRVLLVAATFPVPFTNLVSGALLVLVTGREGWRLAAADALLAWAVILGFLVTAGGAWFLPAAAAAGFWAGAILAGHLLARYRSLALAFQALVALAAAGVVVAGVLIPDPGALWTPVLRELLGQGTLPAGLPSQEDWLPLVARMMNGLLAASTVTSIALAVVVGHWLDRRGSDLPLGDLFSRVRMGRVIGLATLGALALTLGGATQVGGGLLLTLGVGFVLQGLAVVHWTARRRGWPAAWPLAVYLPLALSPPVAGAELLLLCLLGLVDNWISLRPGVQDGAGDVLK